jgi:hypothetical protein
MLGPHYVVVMEQDAITSSDAKHLGSYFSPNGTFGFRGDVRDIRSTGARHSET